MVASGDSQRIEPATLHEIGESHESARLCIRSKFMTSPGVMERHFGGTDVEKPQALATVLLVGPGGCEEQAQIALAATASRCPGLPGATGRTPEFRLGWHVQLSIRRSAQIGLAACGMARYQSIAFTHPGGRRRDPRPRER